MSILAKLLDGSRWHLAWTWARSRIYCARWRPSFSSQKMGHTPNFRPISIVAKLLDASRCHLVLVRGRTRRRPHYARRGPGSPFPKRGQSLLSPQFVAHVYCSQTAGCIKMPLGMEVGLGPGHITLDGDPAFPPQKKKIKWAQPSNFRPMSIVAKRLDGSRWHMAWR